MYEAGENDGTAKRNGKIAGCESRYPPWHVFVVIGPLFLARISCAVKKISRAMIFLFWYGKREDVRYIAYLRYA